MLTLMCVLATVWVSQPAVAAQKLVLASQGSGLYLALVPPDNQPTPVPPVNAGNLFTGGLTPYEG